MTVCMILVYMSACTNTTKEKSVTVKELSWLEGEWINDADTPAVTYETWKTINDSLMTGEGYSIENGDTVFHERLEIKVSDNTICYIPSVDNQNEGKPIVFKLKNAKDGLFEFSNPQHDFPQTITYQKAGNDSLFAWIEGINNGKQSKLSFPFRKKK